jgi:hypothetical protein
VYGNCVSVWAVIFEYDPVLWQSATMQDNNPVRTGNVGQAAEAAEFHAAEVGAEARVHSAATPHVVRIDPPISSQNPYYDEGKPYFGFVTDPQAADECQRLVQTYGPLVPTLPVLQKIAGRAIEHGIGGVVGVCSGNGYTESCFSAWFNFEVVASDSRVREAHAPFGVTVEKRDAVEMASLHADKVLFLNFPGGMSTSEIVSAFHRAGGELIVYADSSAHTRANVDLNAYLALHAQPLFSTRLDTFVPPPSNPHKARAMEMLAEGDSLSRLKFDPRHILSMWRLDSSVVHPAA